MTAVLDNSGDVVEKYEYAAFGGFVMFDGDNNLITTSAIGNEFLFQGRRFDSETNLYYFRARMYDHSNGRFLSHDPLGYKDSMSMYQAFGGNPVNKKDPKGKDLGDFGSGSNITKSGTDEWSLGDPNTRTWTDEPEELPVGTISFEEDLDALQTMLDIVGMIPLYGEPADIINSLISLARQKFVDAAISLAAAVPIIGWMPTIVKWLKKLKRFISTAVAARKAAIAARRIKKTTKAIQKGAEVSKDLAKALPAEKVAKQTAEEAAEGVGKAGNKVSKKQAKKEVKDGLVNIGAKRALSKKEQIALAESMGYKMVKDAPFNAHGQLVFKKGKKYISYDWDKHRGPAWKVFEKRTRKGTYDLGLDKRIGN